MEDDDDDDDDDEDGMGGAPATLVDFFLDVEAVADDSGSSSCNAGKGNIKATCFPVKFLRSVDGG